MSRNSDVVNVFILNEGQIASTDVEKTIFKLDKQIDALSSHVDQMDYFVAVASGIERKTTEEASTTFTTQCCD